MERQGFGLYKDVQIFKRLHPRGDVYFLRVAAIGGAALIVQLLAQISTAIGLLK